MSFSAEIPDIGGFAAWRQAARLAISHRIAPAEITWNGDAGLFEGQPLPDTEGANQAHVPAEFLKLAKSVAHHSAPERFALLYQALWALDTKTGLPLSSGDPLGRRLALMAKSVSRDIHKMHAFVRFRELPSAGPRRSFAAWFEPEHYTLELGTPFFAKRFADMDWLIATPHQSAKFENGALSFHVGTPKPDLPEDASQSLWATYFANIFNPARVKLAAMTSEMPKKYWRNLPETQLIPGMLADAEARVRRMQEAGATAPRPGAAAISTRYRAAMPRPEALPQSMEAARASALQCKRCGLCEAATQTVWGEGAADAELMIVGEQPGDREDLTGRPFVGPAGEVLHQVMREAALDPADLWLTNAVKHFKFSPRGKQRLHKSPDRGEIEHCRWWLGLELAFVQPRLVVALGASAAFALTGDASPLAERRGKIEIGRHGGPVLLSWHPSYILRLQDAGQQQAARAELLADLQHARAQAYALSS